MKTMIAAVVLFACYLSTHAEKANIVLIIAYEDKEQPPYYMGNTSEVLKEKPGVAVEMIQMLEKELDITILLVRYPWKRCTTMLSINEVDGIFNASFLDERWEIGWYPTINKQMRGKIDESRRITTISYSLYVLDDSRVQWDGTALLPSSSVIGAPMGYSITDNLKKLGVIVEESPSTYTNLEKLLHSRIDAVALQDVTADSILSTNPKKYAAVKKLAPPLSVKPYYLMLSHNFVAQHPQLAQRIWDAIKKIREKHMSRLVKKYRE